MCGSPELLATTSHIQLWWLEGEQERPPCVAMFLGQPPGQLQMSGWKDLGPRLAEATVWVQVELRGRRLEEEALAPPPPPWATPLSPAVSHRSTMGQD